MDLPSHRRGFLRGLVTLPLIGGGVSLIGTPTAVAEPVTTDLMLRYCAWLAHEHRAALVEQARLQAAAEGCAPHPDRLDRIQALTRKQPPMFWFPESPAVENIIAAAPPSSRAALVLSAVGLPWNAEAL